MGANQSQPSKDHKEEHKPKRSPTLSFLGKSSSRLNLLNLGKRSPQPPATPVTPQAATMVMEFVAEQGTASPEVSAVDPEERPEEADGVSLSLPLSRPDLTARSAVSLRASLVHFFPSYHHIHQDLGADIAITMPQQPVTVPCQVRPCTIHRSFRTIPI